jgi:pyrroloquinoline quinone biosynthesis protein B
MAILTLLGIAQDGGRPQPGCTRSCCEGLTEADYRSPVSLSIQTNNGTTLLIEATRDLGRQLRMIGNPSIDHLFITHAHLGHVDGLGLFGRETMSARNIQLHCSPSMYSLIERTPAWNQLLLQNVLELGTFPRIEIDDVIVEFIHIPHRAELSDMHAIIIRGREKSLLFLPDHDSWNETLVAHSCNTIRDFLNKYNIDIALLDGTFWSGGELQGRDMSVVPHPTIEDSLQRLGSRKQTDPDISFIHLNHTNPAYDQTGIEHQELVQLGWRLGEEGQSFKL